MTNENKNLADESISEISASNFGSTGDKEPGDIKNKKRFWIALSAIFVLTAIAFFIVNYKLFTAKEKRKKEDASFNLAVDDMSINTSDAKLLRRKIDGVYVKEGRENIYPTAVMVENHVDSRPPSALSRANLVFEAEAEGSITRFLAIYASGEDLDKIGPIRSARSYYMDWAREFNALYVHCGGSPDALAKIKQYGINGLNEFYNGKYFWRADGKPAPHNVYISSANLEKAVTDRQLDQASYESWKFKNDAPTEERPATSSLFIAFRAKPFEVEWKYNKENNLYERFMAGELHKDEDSKIISAKNVAVMFVNAQVMDEELRLAMENIGTGKAIICSDGWCREGWWRKSSGSARTRFYVTGTASAIAQNRSMPDDSYEEAEFNAGITWIEVVRPGYEVVY